MTLLARARPFAAASLFVMFAAGCGPEDADTALPAGPHSDLACAECHTTPAVGGFVAAVPSGTCGQCHADADLDRDVEIHNVALAHLTHPGVSEDRGLGCAACHTHDSGDTDLTIATASCFLCHADLAQTAGGEATITESSCSACHVQPSHTGFAASGAPIDHAMVLDRGISCLLCHYDVAEGSGAATQAKCRACHGATGGPAPLRGDESMAASSVHPIHLDSAIALSCTRCHEPVNHAVIRLASSLVLECEACHAPGDPALATPVDSTVHRAVQQLYAGLDPHHPDVDPSLKFMERVACSGCHAPASTALPARSPQQLELIRRECDACHGATFGPLLGPWVAGMRSNTSLVGSFVRAAAANPAVRGSAMADSLAASAVEIWQHVSTGDGVHNLPGADALLRTALDEAARSYRQAGLSAPARPALGPDPRQVSCVRCHYGVQTLSGAVYDQAFDHDRHILTGALSCNRCHGSADLFAEDGTTFDPAHGSTLIAQADCSGCHHVDQVRECATCHTPAEVTALRVRADLTVHVQRDSILRTREVGFSHSAHDAVGCTECHAPGRAQNVIGCTDCHESHHGGMAGFRTCNACHTTDVLSRHEQADHLVCGACHSRTTLALLETADRRFCLQCHTTRADHEPDGECSTCHLLLDPAETMRQILNARTAPRGPQ